MSNWRHSFNLWSLLLLSAITFSAGYLYYQWRFPMNDMGSGVNQADEKKAPQPGNERAQTRKFVPVSIKAYEEITQRPLFVEGRLPPAEPEKKTAIARKPHKPLRLKLEGVAMMPDNRVAIIRDLDSNELLRVSQGMKKNDWKVESVDSESATIARKGERLILKLEMDANPANKQKQPKRNLPFRPSKR